MASELVTGIFWWYPVVSSGWNLASDLAWGIPLILTEIKRYLVCRVDRAQLVSVGRNTLIFVSEPEPSMRYFSFESVKNRLVAYWRHTVTALR